MGSIDRVGITRASNIVPLIKVPGVTNVHGDLCLRQRFVRARDRQVWPDSAIVRVVPA